MYNEGNPDFPQFLKYLSVLYKRYLNQLPSVAFYTPAIDITKELVFLFCSIVSFPIVTRI